MPKPEPSTTRAVLDRCRALGFALAGVAQPQPSQWAEQLQAWLAAGKHGEMQYLEKHMAVRLDPATILPGTRSIICVADRYHDGRRDRMPEPGFGRIARYARGRDYHKVMKQRLHTLADELAGAFQDATFRACVDTAPVMERELAVDAGLGAIGKHTLLIEPGVGSWLLLGELFTTLQLEPTHPEPRDVCGSCTRCIDACPTDAIEPFVVDATRCISYLTIEHRSEIDSPFHEAIGHWIFGCDICQDVCPHNQATRRSRAAVTNDAYRTSRAEFDLLDVLGWTEDDRRDAFTGSAMKRARLNMMKRNALIAATNAAIEHNLAHLQDAIVRIAENEHEDSMVRVTARVCHARLETMTHR